MQSSAGEEEEEEEGMNLEQSSDHTNATVTGCPPPPTPLSPMLGNAELATSLTPPLDNRNARRAQQPSADMCGSLHLTGAVNHRSDWWSLMEAGGGDLLQYGHFHGFGDTAEDLSDGGKPSPAGTPVLLHCS
uniref:Uncharacterized protein n=1 Tax=Oryzias sinensis TaxID=183150 RepID=A0A8C7Y627_9TELE